MKRLVWIITALTLNLACILFGALILRDSNIDFFSEKEANAKEVETQKTPDTNNNNTVSNENNPEEAEILLVVAEDKLILEGFMSDPDSAKDLEEAISSLTDNTVDNQIQITNDKKIDLVSASLTIQIEEPILFPTDNQTLEDGYTDMLDSISQLLIKDPDALMTIISYSDSSDNEELNESVLKLRASTVSDYLISEGVPESSIEVDLRGETDEFSTNNTEKGQEANRRVILELSDVSIDNLLNSDS